MAHTKVLLREDVDDLGARGEIVRVRAGYARNYLLPRNLAVRSSGGNSDLYPKQTVRPAHRVLAPFRLALVLVCLRDHDALLHEDSPKKISE